MAKKKAGKPAVGKTAKEKYLDSLVRDLIETVRQNYYSEEIVLEIPKDKPFKKLIFDMKAGYVLYILKNQNPRGYEVQLLTHSEYGKAVRFTAKGQRHFYLLNINLNIDYEEEPGWKPEFTYNHEHTKYVENRTRLK